VTWIDYGVISALVVSFVLMLVIDRKL